MNQTEIEVYQAAKKEITSVERENPLLRYLGHNGLPYENIIVEVTERAKVIDNFESAIRELDCKKKLSSLYLSKFVAAVASGLFDAALNYLWDETINCLRVKICTFDVTYFYDNINVFPELRDKLKTDDDMVLLSDDVLINGARNLDYITDIGYKRLMFIKEMRNWISAAHPNQSTITGFDLLSWLETCVREVINSEVSTKTIRLGQFLKNIREQTLEDETAASIISFIGELHTNQIDTLLIALYSIYCNKESNTHTRNNILKIVKTIWSFSSDEIKYQIGMKHGEFALRADSVSERLSNELINHVQGRNYLPENIRTVEIDQVLNSLYNANINSNNFYSEPPLALMLKKYVENSIIPKQIESRYVKVLVFVYLTNGYGIAWNAEPIYEKLIKDFTPFQAKSALVSCSLPWINSKLCNFKLCEDKFIEIINMIEIKIPEGKFQDLLREFKESKIGVYKKTQETKNQKLIDLLNSSLKSD